MQRTKYNVFDGIPEETELYNLTDFFKVLGDSTRIKILLELLKNEFCVGELAEILNMTVSAVSHQPQILKSSRLVRKRRDGRTIIYSLADDHVRSVIAQGWEHISE